MIGALMVHGHQQWRSDGLSASDFTELSFLYHCVALIKKAEADAAEDARKNAGKDSPAPKKRPHKRSRS